MMQCSRLLEGLLCGHAKLWRSIRLDHSERLSDDALSKLLLRVNARGVCTHLSLVGCSSVSGTGLAPLEGSRALEVLDFRTRSTPPDLEETRSDPLSVDLGIAALDKLIRSICKLQREPKGELKGAAQSFRLLLLDPVSPYYSKDELELHRKSPGKRFTERFSVAQQKLLKLVSKAVRARRFTDGTKCRVCKAAFLASATRSVYSARRALCAGCGTMRPCRACEEERFSAKEIEQRRSLTCESCCQYWCGLCVVKREELMHSCYSCGAVLCSVCSDRFMEECDCGTWYCRSEYCNTLQECDSCAHNVVCSQCTLGWDHLLCEDCADLEELDHYESDSDSESYNFDDLLGF
jgi:hypothetical protein